MPALQDLAAWLHLRGPRSDAAAAEPVVPAGDGPLVLICGGAASLSGLAKALRRGRRGVRVGGLGPVAVDRGDRPVPIVLPEPPVDTGSARALIARLDPSAVVLTDGALPGALIAACDEAGVPVTLMADRMQLAAAAARSAWRGVRRGPVARVSRVLVHDAAAHDTALRDGIAPQRIELIGQPTTVLPPLNYNARELSALRPLMRGRHIWLAAALPASEAVAVAAAQAALLSAHHRALLICAAATPEDAEPVAMAAEAAGLIVARRWVDEDPNDEVQVLVAEDTSELGLWYRLASVCFAGGTLDPGEAVPRHPFEPAGHGAAIIHGPHLPQFADDWRMLDGAGATRRVSSLQALPQAVEDLTAPDTAARLAHAAWTVATAGADVTRHVAELVLSDLPEPTA